MGPIITRKRLINAFVREINRIDHMFDEEGVGELTCSNLLAKRNAIMDFAYSLGILKDVQATVLLRIFQESKESEENE